MTDPETKRFPSQRLSLSYVEWGRADAPLLLLVHGGRDQKRSWDWTARALADRYRVIAHDLRGHGDSDRVSDGDYGVMDHVYDLASLVDHLGDGSVILLGHSLGGNIVLRYTGLFPERVSKLVAIEGLGPSPGMLAERQAVPIETRAREWIDQRRTLSTRSARAMASPEEAYERMKAAHGHLKEDQLRHLAETGARANADGTYRWAYDPAVLGRSPSDISHDDFVRLWTRIPCPVWLVYGAESWASNPAEDGRARHFQNAEVTIVENAGHWVHHDQFETFATGLSAFLE